MKCDEYDSPAFITNLHNAPYSSSLATSASASSASVWSDVCSQSSDDTSVSAPTSDSDSCDSYYHSRQACDLQTSESACEIAWSKQQTQHPNRDIVPPELRQNPRRSSTSSTTRSGCPPTLVRQADRKVNFVDNLVGKPSSLSRHLQ
jgi:PHO85 cyclin-5